MATAQELFTKWIILANQFGTPNVPTGSFAGLRELNEFFNATTEVCDVADQLTNDKDILRTIREALDLMRNPNPYVQQHSKADAFDRLLYDLTR